MCTAPYKQSKNKMVKLHFWMQLAPEYLRQNSLIVVWQLAMYPNTAKMKRVPQRGCEKLPWSF